MCPCSIDARRQPAIASNLGSTTGIDSKAISIALRACCGLP
jgi:hypothetical protein